MRPSKRKKSTSIVDVHTCTYIFLNFNDFRTCTNLRIFSLNGCAQVRQRIAKSIAVLLTSGSTESSIKRSYGHSMVEILPM
jgi:hypothetical protein